MVSTHFENKLVKIRSFPQIWIKIKNIWNHHLEQDLLKYQISLVENVYPLCVDVSFFRSSQGLRFLAQLPPLARLPPWNGTFFRPMVRWGNAKLPTKPSFNKKGCQDPKFSNEKHPLQSGTTRWSCRFFFLIKGAFLLDFVDVFFQRWECLATLTLGCHPWICLFRVSNLWFGSHLDRHTQMESPNSNLV